MTTFHPAARRPRLAVLVGLLLTALSLALLGWLPGAPALALSLGLWGSLASFFLPTVYRLEKEVLVVKLGPLEQRHPWRRFRRVVRDRNGLLLSPFERPHPLEGFRGLFLPLEPHQARSLAPTLEARLS